MKKIIVSVVWGILALSWRCLANDEPVVAITQIVSHPALDANYQGIVEQLAEEGYEDGKNITILHEIAQGDLSLAMQIAQKFVGEKPAVMVGISTPSAQVLASVSHGKYPIVFSSVTDPIAAKLVSKDRQPDWLTGVEDSIPSEKTINMIQSILPKVKRIGTVYNPGEANSESAITKIEKSLADVGITLLKAPASKTSDVLDATRSLIGKVDAIYITLDNTAVSALDSIILVCQQNHIPLFAADTASVLKGAIAAIGVDYVALGHEVGKQVAQVLRGKKPGDIPVQALENMELYINTVAAEKMGVQIPSSVKETAARIVETAE